ncbi:maleylpyruvate isomerase N-terminal domain-containing protein [Streptomyces orinoci]|uniref:Maleylpyruvate isomerase N-terminal domain-containing protein n=1 Tax=Streptomyces orinoci TaxID=67339 RepID=A0ABV3JQ35_STRON|nr:maleylpyruvate isomerase N-terminal domain-containing protein [Streptomyces orinoci]
MLNSQRPAGPVTAEDVQTAVHLTVDALTGVPEARWGRPAAGLDWDCWETAEHLVDALFGYAAQLGPRAPSLERYLPSLRVGRRPGGPRNVVFADREAGPDGLLQLVEAGGGLLTAMVRTTPAEVMAYHPAGRSDPAGFGAMGVVEALVHGYDIAAGLGVEFTPPAGPCERALARLFPDAPQEAEPWPALLWCTGRSALPGREKLNSWRWHSSPR